MTSIEQTGRSVEEATQLALEQLGVTEDDVHVEILEEGSKGFLGLGQAPARVRVSLKDSAMAKKRTRPAPAKTSPEPEEVSAPEEEQPVSEPVQPVSGTVEEQAAEMVKDILQHVLEGMGDEAEVVVRSASDGQVVLDLVGGETAVLVGKHGQTINALQYLVGIIVNRRLSEQVRIVLDAEGYRNRREETLRSQALYLASKVKESGQEAVLEPLQAHERRIVHLALVDDPDVETYSEGDGSERHVVISPRK